MSADASVVKRERSVLALIPARGGSKGLLRKNVLPVGGRPLVAWTIAAALESSSTNRVVLSSDDDEIMAAARAWGCDVPFRRPDALAGDAVSSIDVALHALDQLPEFDYLVLLQPTSPLRTGADIDAAFALMLERNACSCVSVCEAEQSPYWMYTLRDDGRMVNLLPDSAEFRRRQDLPPVYVLNGALYIVRVDWFREHRCFVGEDTVAYRMPVERSIDIDTAEDFELFRRCVER